MRESPVCTQWQSPAGLMRGGERAVRLLLCGDGRQLDDDVGFFHDLLEH